MTVARTVKTMGTNLTLRHANGIDQILKLGKLQRRKS